MKKIHMLLASLLLISMSGCNEKPSEDITPSTSNSEDQSESHTESNEQTPSSEDSSTPSDSEIPSEETSKPERFDIETINKEPFRLSSIDDRNGNNPTISYRMVAPYFDTYRIACNIAHRVAIYDKHGYLIKESEKTIQLKLNKDQEVIVSIDLPIGAKFHLDVFPFANKIELPYQINSQIDLDTLDTNGNPNVNPLEACELHYTKRNDGKGLYVNCNNPEKISNQEFNTVLTRQDVTDKEVFFTFEHNNASTMPYYYGYRVTNTSNEDIFVTVKNIGYQINGKGSWLGENEWIQFYNIKFDASSDHYTYSQKSNFDAYVSFGNQYRPAINKPTTYRIPSGKYMYVMGGTVADAYEHIDVCDTANKRVSGSCGNGAVLFDVTGGKAEGAFLVYTDPNAKTINESKYIKDGETYGYIVQRGEDMVGAQYSGYDECHGVVDADLYWTFNDKTPKGSLPVKYTNPYFTTRHQGNKYSKIESMIPQTHFKDSWYTHINPNHTSKAVGTDMTIYKNVDYLTKKPITISPEYYDGRGELANIGNWMVDYIDTITLVNQGDKERTFTYTLGHNGVILAFVRDHEGFIDSENYLPKYCVRISASSYGDAIHDNFEYSVTIKPHSIARFSVNYNLLANSYGTISHQATLS